MTIGERHKDNEAEREIQQHNKHAKSVARPSQACKKRKKREEKTRRGFRKTKTLAAQNAEQQ